MQHQSRRNLDDLLFLILKKSSFSAEGLFDKSAFNQVRFFLGICAENQCKCYVMGCFYWFFVEKKQVKCWKYQILLVFFIGLYKTIINSICMLQMEFKKALAAFFFIWQSGIFNTTDKFSPKVSLICCLSVRRPLGVFCESNCFQVLITRTFENFQFVGNVGE